jgi:PAS domain S-box-containing protein
METKKAGKPPLVSKATMEFVIAILLAVVLFSILNFLGGFDRFFQMPVYQHIKFHDKLLFFAAFLAAAMVIFAFRRWLELRRAYKKLAQSEEKLRFQSMLLDEIGDSVLATDLEGKITYVNQAQCNWKNKNKDELIGQSVRTFDLDNSLESIQQEIIQTTLEKGNWSGEFVSRAAAGNKIIVECRTWLMKDKNGNPTGLCGVTGDVTERKERELELQKHKRYLEALGIATQVLLHSISDIKY